MKNIRIILPMVALGTVAATVVGALLGGAVWALVVATAGILSSLMLLGWVLVKTLQTVMQRQTGLIRVIERLSADTGRANRRVQQIQAQVTTASPQLTREMQRVMEDLRLASRSLTVPQAHFDQLLRSVSANTVRTEAAIDDALSELRSTAQSRTEQSSEPVTAGRESVE